MNSTLNPKYIIADHIRAITFIISEGVFPAGKGRGYILRRLMRRLISASLKLNIDISDANYYNDLVKSVVVKYDDIYPELNSSVDNIANLLLQESVKYNKAVLVGKKEWAKILS